MLTLPFSYVLLPETAPSSVRVLRSAILIATDGHESSVHLKRFTQGVSGRVPDATFRFALPTESDRTVAQGVYLNTVEPHVDVRMNDRQIFSTRVSSHPHAITAFKPIFFALPHPLPADALALELRISGASGQGTMLTELWIGPLTALGPIYAKRDWIRTTGTHLMIALYALVGLSSIAFWLSDVHYLSTLWFGVFCAMAAGVAWTGLASTEPILPLALNLHLTIFLLSCAIAALAQFFFEKTHTRSTAKDRLLIGYLMIAAALAFVLFEDALPLFRYAIVMDSIALLVGLYVLFVLLRAWSKQRDSLTTALVAGCAITFGLGALTFFVSWLPGIERAETYSLLYAPLPLMFTMGWVIIGRYARARLRTEAMNRRLEKRVARKEIQISAAYAALATMRQTEIVRRERDRFMHDMHDGLGSKLITALRMAERSELTTRTMREVLSDCLDEMHFAIESLKPSGNDLFVVLADYRYRIEPRMEMAGITMKWRIDPTEAVALTSAHVVQVLRILNEAIANTIKHAQCRLIRVEGRPFTQLYKLSVADSGATGFDPTVSPGSKQSGNGLANMKRRAAQIGATLTITSGIDGTVIALLLPLRCPP